jgi:dihydroorotate dehydrogenase
VLDLAYPLVRRALFRLDAERAHEWTIRAVSAAPRLLGALARLTCGSPDPRLARTVAGVRWAGPVGLAAGLDKDGRAIPFWPALGFGSVEVGTVTALPQPGNPRPRLFRVPEDRALVNRMGFNNRGSAALADRLRALRERGRWPAVPVGVNVGKSRVTPLEEAPEDYATSVRRLQGLADWFTVNVSSPNTPGLRDLQEREPLRRVLDAVLAVAGDTPVLLKLAPDLAPEALADAVELAWEAGARGIVATNTTIGRDGLSHDPGEEGGLSGAPLWPLARARIGVALQAARGRLPVIGVGGIETAAQVRELLDAGCAAVQIYTALIYAGPGLPARLHRALLEDADA